MDNFLHAPSPSSIRPWLANKLSFKSFGAYLFGQPKSNPELPSAIERIAESGSDWVTILSRTFVKLQGIKLHRNIYQNMSLNLRKRTSLCSLYPAHEVV